MKIRKAKLLLQCATRLKLVFNVSILLFFSAKCNIEYQKLGCFVDKKANNLALSEKILSNQVDFDKWGVWLPDFVCRCANLAYNKNYNVFGVHSYGMYLFSVMFHIILIIGYFIFIHVIVYLVVVIFTYYVVSYKFVRVQFHYSNRWSCFGLDTLGKYQFSIKQHTKGAWAQSIFQWINKPGMLDGQTGATNGVIMSCSGSNTGSNLRHFFHVSHAC